MPHNLSPAESIRLIESMINKTKENIGENRLYFLLWGWVIFGAVLLQFFLKTVVEYKHHYMVWLAVIPTSIITMVLSNRKSGTQYRTWIGDSMGYFWMGIGISFFVLSFIISNIKDGWLNAYPFFILFYGLGTFVSGKILQFRPLVIGGIINWVLAIVCVYVTYDYQLLITAAAILCSYIIPGYLISTEKQNSFYGA
jgi:hypothetical protein